MDSSTENRAETLASILLNQFGLEHKFEIELGSLREPIIERLRSKGCGIIRHQSNACLITVVCPPVAA
jgi:hypothetical protein